MANSKTIRAADGGYLLDAEQFKYTKDELGRPVPMTGDLQLGGHAIFGVHSISGEVDQPVAIESDADMNNHRITSVSNPTANQDAATKVYVDSKCAAMLPPITEAANGKVLGVVDGQLAWVSKA